MRIKKGFWRGLMLIGIGYALRIPLFQWLNLDFGTSFLKVDVLQVIGFSLILVIAVYLLCLKNTLAFSISMLVLANLIFLTEPLYRNLELPEWPLFLSNYLTKVNGSVFTVLPWFGYMAFGAFIATLFYKYLNKKRFRAIIVIGFVVIGMSLIQLSSYGLMLLHHQFDIQLFKDVAYYNYLFTRLGNVLLLFAIFYSFEAYLKRPLILKIGQKTLSIYVIHFIIIYGSFTGIGLSQIFGPTLNPWQAIVGALLFLVVVCFLSFYYMKPNVFIYKQLLKFVENKRNKSQNA